MSANFELELLLLNYNLTFLHVSSRLQGGLSFTVYKLTICLKQMSGKTKIRFPIYARTSVSLRDDDSASLECFKEEESSEAISYRKLHTVNNKHIAWWLLTYGADVNELDDEGCTPLATAVRDGRADVVAVLLLHGGDLTSTLTWETLLFTAVDGRHRDVVAVLLSHDNEAGVHLQGGLGGETVLHYTEDVKIPELLPFSYASDLSTRSSRSSGVTNYTAAG